MYINGTKLSGLLLKERKKSQLLKEHTNIDNT